MCGALLYTVCSYFVLEIRLGRASGMYPQTVIYLDDQLSYPEQSISFLYISLEDYPGPNVA